MRALTNNLLQTVRRYGTRQCGHYRYEFTYELTRITKVSTQWYIGINILGTYEQQGTDAYLLTHNNKVKFAILLSSS